MVDAGAPAGRRHTRRACRTPGGRRRIVGTDARSAAGLRKFVDAIVGGVAEARDVGRIYAGVAAPVACPAFSPASAVRSRTSARPTADDQAADDYKCRHPESLTLHGSQHSHRPCHTRPRAFPAAPDRAAGRPCPDLHEFLIPETASGPGRTRVVTHSRQVINTSYPDYKNYQLV